MDIEIKQTITQIVAFLLMLWILNRYAWKPLLALLDERTAKIQAIFKEAEDKNLEAVQNKKIYEDKINAIKDEGQLIIQNAIKDAKKISEDLTLDAQKKVQDILTKAHEQAARDLQKAKIEFKKEMVDLSFIALEKLIHLKFNSQERQRYVKEVLNEI